MYYFARSSPVCEKSAYKWSIKTRLTVQYTTDAPIAHFEVIMMTSSNGNIFRVTGHLSGEFTGRRWIPRTKASDAEL